jgi:hypothetical protein
MLDLPLVIARAEITTISFFEIPYAVFATEVIALNIFIGYGIGSAITTSAG